MNEDIFPGPIERVSHCKYNYTKEQIEWIRRHYVDMRYQDLVSITGLTWNTIKGLCKGVTRNRRSYFHDYHQHFIKMRERHPEKYSQMCKHISETLKRKFKMERLLIMSGEKQRTKLNVNPFKYNNKQRTYVYNMRMRGYFLVKEDRFTIYYDEDTKRSKIREDHAKWNDFIIKEWKDGADS